MFLDDQIVEMVLEANPQSLDEELNLLNKVIDLCLTRLSENLKKDWRDENIVPATRQVCNVFDSASRTLVKKGFPYLKQGGFRDFLMNHPNYGSVLKKVGF